MKKPTESLMTIEDVMDYLPASRPKVMALVLTGELPATNIARTKTGELATGKHARYRIDPADLDRFVQAGRISA